MYIKDFYDNIKSHQNNIIKMQSGGYTYNKQVNEYQNKLLTNEYNNNILKLIDDSVKKYKDTMKGGGKKNNIKTKLKEFRALVKKQCSNVKKLYTNIKKQQLYISKKNLKSLELHQSKFKDIIKEGLIINRELNNIKSKYLNTLLPNNIHQRDASKLIDKLLKDF